MANEDRKNRPQAPSAVRKAMRARAAVILGGSAAAALLVALLLSGGRSTTTGGGQEVEIVPKGFEQDTWANTVDTRISSLEKSMSDTQDSLNRLQESIEEIIALQRASNERLNEVAEASEEAVRLANEARAEALAAKERAVLPPAAVKEEPSVVPPPPAPPPTVVPGGSAGKKGATPPRRSGSVEVERNLGSAQIHTNPTGPIVIKGEDVTDSGPVHERESSTLWSGSMVPIKSMHGVTVGATDAYRTNPAPVSFVVSDMAYMPNSARYDVTGCVIQGSAFGELASETVKVRLSRITCFDKEGGVGLSAKLSGYVIASNGLADIPAKVEKKAGAQVGLATLANFFSAMSGIVPAAYGMGTTGGIAGLRALGGVPGQELPLSDAAKAAFGMGGAGAAKELADYFLEQADRLFPTLTINPGTPLTAVLTSNVELVWGEVEK